MLRAAGSGDAGRPANGVAHLRQGLAADARPGTQMLRPTSSLLAEAYGQAGQPEAGLPVLRGFTLVGTMDAGGGRPSCIVSKGALLLQLPSPGRPQAETCLRQASRWPVASRPRPWSSGGAEPGVPGQRRASAPGPMRAAGTISAGSPRGLTTADIKEAKALLRELEGNTGGHTSF